MPADLIHPWPVLQALILLMVANAAPVLGKRLLGPRWAWPLDGGARFMDGQPLLGRSKTLRGLVLAVLATALAAPLIGLDWRLGVLVAALSMLGDLASSFVKRRLRLPPSAMAPGLDHMPESLLPLLAARAALGLGILDIALAAVLFWLGSIGLSRLSFQAGIKDRPY